MFSLCPNDPAFIASIELLIKTLGGAGALIIFLIGLRRFKRDQIWKRREFIAKEIKDFTSDPMAVNAMYMLDWGMRFIELFPNKPIYKDRFVKVDRAGLCLALQIHKNRSAAPGKVRFNEAEVAVRDTFDHFFNYFERFNQFIKAKMIYPEELRPYLEYWIETFGTGLEPLTKKAICEYIDFYKFRGVQQLFEYFGITLKS